jgi:pimeloyl-ACP methyl ester carboxylesterase
VSVLRYVAAYRDQQGNGYTSVVIVAHSLGALISADLLRYLRDEGDRKLEALGFGGPGGTCATIPLKLFTMGNPLRQLLNRFFPHLYHWMRDVPDGSLQPLAGASAVVSAPIPANALPDPNELGVAQWTNAYRSGDYVGRSLWLDEWYCRNSNGLERGSAPESLETIPAWVLPWPSRCEMCIGAGAHQHYWDDTAPDIARQLDLLLQ